MSYGYVLGPMSLRDLIERREAEEEVRRQLRISQVRVKESEAA